jgi:NDP-sugar pyrophosphorylase family protein
MGREKRVPPSPVQINPAEIRRLILQIPIAQPQTPKLIRIRAELQIETEPPSLMAQTITKAVLLAAGKGTRMRELTTDLPKPMLLVRGKPILQHIVEGLRDAGISRFLLVVGYREEVVRECFGDGGSLGVAIEYVTQTVQDGTGRVVELARDFVGDDPFVLSYGDILIDPSNYRRLVDLGDAKALVSVKFNPGEVAKGGAVFVNERFELVDLREKPQPGEPVSPWYNAGVYAFDPEIFHYTARLEKSPRGEYELTDAIRALAQSGAKVQAFELTGSWADVRDPEVLAELNSGTE